MELKPATTYEQQLALMEKRGLIISDRDFALTVLQNVNYYVLSGYLHGFKQADDSYESGLTFKRVYMLYKFDCRLKCILLHAMENIEQALKAKIAHTLAMQYPDNPCMYENGQLFRNANDYERFIKTFRKTVKNNAFLPFVDHYIRKYGGHFPIWVAVELFTLGNIKVLYRNIPNQIRRSVSREFDESPVVLDSWIENLRRTRNTLAHDMRLYDMSFQFTPKLSEKHHVYRVVTNRIFDQVYLLKILHWDRPEWGIIVSDIREILESYSEYIHLAAIGFPDNWEDILQQS